jgi:hypothetical protein
MFFFFSRDRAKFFASNKGLMSLLRSEARMRKNMAASALHPDTDILYDYVLESLPVKKMREITDHLCECKECVGKVLEIRRLDKDITKDFRQYMQALESKTNDSPSDDPL